MILNPDICSPILCQSGECQTVYGCSQRKVIYLEETTNLCPRLDARKKNRNVWLINLDNMGEDNDDEDDDQFNNLLSLDDDDVKLNEPVQTAVHSSFQENEKSVFYLQAT